MEPLAKAQGLADNKQPGSGETCHVRSDFSLAHGPCYNTTLSSCEFTHLAPHGLLFKPHYSSFEFEPVLPLLGHTRLGSSGSLHLTHCTELVICLLSLGGCAHQNHPSLFTNKF